MDSVVGEIFVAFIFGSIVGLLVQRSRFCNTAALRDAMLFKTFRNIIKFYSKELFLELLSFFKNVLLISFFLSSIDSTNPELP